MDRFLKENKSNQTPLTEQYRRRVARKALAASIVLLMCLAVCLLIGGSNEATAGDSNYGTARTRPLHMILRAPCADSEYVEAEIGSALINHDMEAFRGLLERNNVVWLDKETTVSKVLSNHLTKIHVESGYYMGKECWVPSKGFFE